jgi:hypothetical protein
MRTVPAVEQCHSLMMCGAAVQQQELCQIPWHLGTEEGNWILASQVLEKEMAREVAGTQMRTVEAKEKLPPSVERSELL